MLNEIIAIYAITDDLLKGIGHDEDSRRVVSDAEIITKKLRGSSCWEQGEQALSPAPEPWSGAEHGYEAPLSGALLLGRSTSSVSVFPLAPSKNCSPASFDNGCVCGDVL